MIMGAASASHTFKKGKYKVTVSDKTYNDLKKGKTTVVKKVGTKIIKKPKYKTKKVTKTKWTYKRVLMSKDVWSSDWSDYTSYDYHYRYDYFTNHGWKWYGTKSVDSNNGHVYKCYYKFKKKVKVTEKKKVKTGYKTIKKPVYMQIYPQFTGDLEHLKPTGKVCCDLSYTKIIAF
jgi:hypothetical protein